MNDPLLTQSENARTALRLAISNVEGHLSSLRDRAGDSAGAAETLSVSWRELVVLLAVEPEPERRECPFCKGPIIRLATRCVHCWKKSLPA